MLSYENLLKAVLASCCTMPETNDARCNAVYIQMSSAKTHNSKLRLTWKW